MNREEKADMSKDEKAIQREKRLLENIFKNIPKIEPTRTELIILEIEYYLNELKRSRRMLPPFFFKASLQLKAQIRSVESILVVAKRIYNG